MRNIFGLGKREAESIALDVTSKVYRKRLAESVSGGDLEVAESKAAFLQNLCEELHFDTEKAIGIHEGSLCCIVLVYGTLLIIIDGKIWWLAGLGNESKWGFC